MKIFSKEVFEEVKNPSENLKDFQEMTKAEQLKWINAYKEYKLEMKVYAKVMETGKTVNEVFYKDAEIEADKKDLALTRYEMLRETNNSDREYTMNFARHSYDFDCAQTQDVRTRFEIYRYVKTFTIRPYLQKERQSAYGFF